MAFLYLLFFFFQAEDGIRDADVTGVQTCALPICLAKAKGKIMTKKRKTPRQCEPARGFSGVDRAKPQKLRPGRDLAGITSCRPCLPFRPYHPCPACRRRLDRKSTRLNSSHVRISYA